MRKDKQIINNNIEMRLARETGVDERDNLLKRMGCFKKRIKDIPPYIENDIEQVINPWLVYKMECEMGFPREIFFELFADQNDIECEEYWSDWCDMWLDDFKKANHKLLFNSKWMIKGIIDNELKEYAVNKGIYEEILETKKKYH